MRISFDLDDTLICYGDSVECEPRLAWWSRILLRDEPLRKGTRSLAAELHARGHILWIYTTSARSCRWIKWWLRLHGVQVEGVINGPMHNKHFGDGSMPTKRPHAFGIDLHVDDSRGVEIEGQQYGFKVCVVEPQSNDWVSEVLDAVDATSEPPPNLQT